MLNVSLLRFGSGFVNFVLVLALGCNLATAQPAYPAHPVRFVVGFGAGTPPDVATRIVAEKLSAVWGATTIVENVVGASGNFAGERVARARPDGHTLLVAPNSGILINPHLFRNMPFNPMQDLAPVSVIYSYPNVLIVNKELGVESIEQLVTLARSKPGTLSYGSAGVGTTMHLAGEMLKSSAGIDIQHVPYRGGTNLFADLLTARIHFSFAPTTSTLGQARAGAVNLLAVTSATRFALMADLPTMKEAGFPDFDMSVWWGVLTPATTPPEVVAKLHRDLAAILALPDVRDRFADIGIEPVGNSPEEFYAMIKAEAPKWEKVIKEAKIGPE